MNTLPAHALSLSDTRQPNPPPRFAIAGKWALGLTLAVAGQCAMGQAMYRMEPVGKLPGCTGSVVAAGLNEADQVAGSSCTPSGSEHAFLWKSGGPMLDLGPPSSNSFSHAVALNESGLVIGNAQETSTGDYQFLASGGPPLTKINDGLGGTAVFVFALNDRGQVTGTAETATGGRRVDAFLWKKGTSMLDLGDLDGNGSIGMAINASGQVTGEAEMANGTDHAFIWKNNGTPMLDLGTLSGGFAQGLFINSSGRVAGNSDVRVAKRLQTHAFIWKNDGTPMQDLGTLGGAASYAIDLNDAGQVAGNSYTVRLRNKRAFIWLNNGTPIKDLGSLGGTYSQANDMNTYGQVTGQATLAGNAVHHAFLWRNDGTKIQDLNTLIDPTDPLKHYVTLFNADFINDRGDIVAEGNDNRTGQQGLYLLHGTALTLAPRSIVFGNHPTHTVSAAQSVTVTNTSTKAVPITSVALAGSDPGQFASTDSCGSFLAGHATCTVRVTFRPTTKGSKSALLNVNGGRGGLLSVHLSGTGT